METGYLIALKFGTRKGGVRANLGLVRIHKVICDYSLKILPTCCCAQRVNHAWQEAENWYKGRLTIEPQTFCGIKEIS